MIAGNAFDVQHFVMAHDRRLTAPPVIDVPHPFARRATARLAAVRDPLRHKVFVYGFAALLLLRDLQRLTY